MSSQPLGQMGSFNHSTNMPRVPGNVLGTKELLYQKEEGWRRDRWTSKQLDLDRLTHTMRRRRWHPTPVLLPGESHGWRSLVGCSPWIAKSRSWLSDFTFHLYELEKEMTTRSSVLAWRIPGTGEPGGLPSMGSHRVGHDWSDLAAAAAFSLQRSECTKRRGKRVHLVLCQWFDLFLFCLCKY